MVKVITKRKTFNSTHQLRPLQEVGWLGLRSQEDKYCPKMTSLLCSFCSLPLKTFTELALISLFQMFTGTYCYSEGRFSEDCCPEDCYSERSQRNWAACGGTSYLTPYPNPNPYPFWYIPVIGCQNNGLSNSGLRISNLRNNVSPSVVYDLFCEKCNSVDVRPFSVQSVLSYGLLYQIKKC